MLVHAILGLALVAAAAAGARAQAREEGVRFVVGGDTLAGTLATPAGPGPHPAIVLLSGMLQDTRDAASGSFRTFKVLSDTLAALGMAVLRYDDRGMGESRGRNTWDYTLEEHAGEAVAALAWLRSRSDIDGRRIGLLGHSYGGPMAARAARQGAAPAFVILASPHVAIDRDIIVGLVRRQQLAAGRPTAQAEDEAAFIRTTIGSATDGQRSWAEVRTALEGRSRAEYLGGLGHATISALIPQLLRDLAHVRATGHRHIVSDLGAMCWVPDPDQQVRFLQPREAR